MSNTQDPAPAKPSNQSFQLFSLIIGVSIVMVVAVPVFVTMYYAHLGRQHLEDLEHRRFDEGASESSVASVFPASTAQDGTNLTATDPCQLIMIDLSEAKYQRLCTDRSDPLTGEDCRQFLEMAWVTGDDSVSPDFGRPAGCPGE